MIAWYVATMTLWFGMMWTGIQILAAALITVFLILLALGGAAMIVRIIAF